MLAKDAEADLVQYPGAIKNNLRYWISRVQIVFISIVTILAQKWISTHENSPVVYITLLQVAVKIII